MNFSDILLMGIKNLLRRKVRSILAIAGVIIGTAAITVMLSLGLGLSAGYENQIQNWGNLHMIDVRPGFGEPDPLTGKTKEAKLDEKSLKELEKIPNLTAISPKVETHMKIAVGRYVNHVGVIGLKPEVFEKFNMDLHSGRHLGKNDKMSVVFGYDAAMSLYNPNEIRYYEEPKEGEEPKLPVEVVNARVKLTSDANYGERRREQSMEEKKPDGTPVNYTIHELKGIGVLKGQSDEYTYSVIMRLEDVQEIIKQNQRDRGENISTNQRDRGNYESATAYVEDTVKVKEVVKTLKNMGYQTFSLVDMLEEVKKMSNIIQAVLGGIGGISLLIAALGITNTMVMSIYERTKEIGIMKVIGANIKDIRKLFLIEAAAIGFFGGLVGLLISYGLSALANILLGNFFLSGMGLDEGTKISIIPWYLSLGSLSFSTAIGIIAGYIPANRAMKLSALESLRNE